MLSAAKRHGSCIGSITIAAILASVAFMAVARNALGRYAANPGGLETDGCQAIHTVATGETLPQIADSYFGVEIYSAAILLATNARVGTRFRPILDPDSLPARYELCIPGADEAQRLRLRYDTYLQAVRQMMLPERWEMSHSLVEVDPTRPFHVVTWVRSDQTANYKVNSMMRARGNIWVTAVPGVRAFCQSFEKARAPTRDELTLRIEQRLGLPPGSNKTAFVEMEIENPGDLKNIFRPCIDPSTSAAHCDVGPPPLGRHRTRREKEYREWFFRQYYMSYAIARPSQFPWTSLGYTFDWAPALDGTDGQRFVRLGESEFVIPAGARFEVKSITDTADYCASP